MSTGNNSAEEAAAVDARREVANQVSISEVADNLWLFRMKPMRALKAEIALMNADERSIVLDAIHEKNDGEPPAARAQRINAAYELALDECSNRRKGQPKGK